MAGEKISEVYCWEIRLDDLHVYLASSEKGAKRVGMGLKKGTDCFAFFRSLFPGVKLVKDEHMNLPLLETVVAALENRPTSGKLALDISCTHFQVSAWKAIARIPFGQTRTYGEVARMIGRDGGARAVGQAMGRNPLPLIFP